MARAADMTTGSIWRHFASFSIPMGIGLLFQQLYNTVDVYVVGQFVSKQALAAVGTTGSIINMMIGLCAGLATGSSVSISQAFGAHDHDRLHRAVHTSISMALILCAVATAVGVLLVDPMLRMMRSPDDVFPEAHQYLTIYMSGLSGVLLYNMGSGILRAVGDSRRPLYFLVFSALLNTVLDFVFVLWFGLGVAGVAWATVISQAVSAILILTVLTREHASYGIRWRKLRIDRKELMGILSVGLPSGLQQAVTSFSNVFVQSYINDYGSSCMAGWGSYNKLDAFILVPVQSISLASTTFVGQNWGAQLPERARKGVRIALSMSLMFTVSLSALTLVFARNLLMVFNSDEEVLSYGVRFIQLITPFYFTICFNQIFGGALRGIGNARTPTVIMLSSFVAFRQIYLYVTKALGEGFVAVALAYPVGWILCSSLLAICYRRSALFRAGTGSQG